VKDRPQEEMSGARQWWNTVGRLTRANLNKRMTMANAESSEPAAVSSASTEAQTPELPRALKPIRSLKVTYGCTGAARVRIEGYWLEDAGFEIGRPVKVHVTHSRLIVELDPLPECGPTKKHRVRRSWVHDYPNLKPPGLDVPERDGGDQPGRVHEPP